MCTENSSAQKSFAKSDMVFVGRVEESFGDNVAVFLKAHKPLASIARRLISQRTITFSVEDTFRGTPPGRTSVLVSFDECIRFAPGETYLVYAVVDQNGGMHTDLCSRTDLVLSRADDIQMLNALRARR
jgi:hypothetical protein